MPYTEKQRIAAAIAEHEPGKLYKRNRGMLSMSREELHDFASGPVKKAKAGDHPGLPFDAAPGVRSKTLKSMQRG